MLKHRFSSSSNSLVFTSCLSLHFKRKILENNLTSLIVFNEGHFWGSDRFWGDTFGLREGKLPFCYQTFYSEKFFKYTEKMEGLYSLYLDSTMNILLCLLNHISLHLSLSLSAYQSILVFEWISSELQASVHFTLDTSACI